MGLECACHAVVDGRRVEGVARLEPRELSFAGPRTLSIPLGPGVAAAASGGRLEVVWPGGTAAFELGAEAEVWALKIRYPRSRLEKLGVTDRTTVSVVGLQDAAFDAELAGCTPHVTAGRVRRGSDLVVFGARTIADLDRLTGYRDAMDESGAIWVVWPKGRKALTETHVRAAAKAQGLVDVKVMSFSDELSALKLVIPRAARTRARRPARSGRRG